MTGLLPETGEIVLFDTEFTAWEGSQQRLWSEPWEHRELVDLGAVRVSAETFAITGEFHRMTVPTVNSTLSDYFTGLTGITQQDLEAKAVPLPDLLDDFQAFCGPARLIASNGIDDRVLIETVRLNGLDTDPFVRPFLNLRTPIAEVLHIDEAKTTTSQLPALVGLDLQKQIHNGLDDARALARALGKLRQDGRI